MPEAAAHAGEVPLWRGIDEHARGVGDLRVGTSGWMYKGWESAFYPPALPDRDHLRFYAERFPTVEVNNTFYRLPTEKALASWRDAVPDGFVFAIKASRYVTHRKRLLEAEEHVPKLTDRLPVLGAKLGPVLFQLPPTMRFDEARLRAFLRVLPEGFRYALELRHASWYREETYAALRERGVAFVAHDFPGVEAPFEVTADFAFVRFHGSSGKPYVGRYTGRRLRPWAERLREVRGRGLDVFAYFNNDVEAMAPKDAAWLLERA